MLLQARLTLAMQQLAGWQDECDTRGFPQRAVACLQPGHGDMHSTGGRRHLDGLHSGSCALRQASSLCSMQWW